VTIEFDTDSKMAAVQRKEDLCRQREAALLDRGRASAVPGHRAYPRGRAVLRLRARQLFGAARRRVRRKRDLFVTERRTFFSSRNQHSTACQ
jgi:hypothetical protein